MSGFIAVASWMASAKALSWSIGSPSDWMVIFCSTLVSTTPSLSVLYWNQNIYVKMSTFTIKKTSQQNKSTHSNSFYSSGFGADGLWADDFTCGAVASVFRCQVYLTSFCSDNWNVSCGSYDGGITAINDAFRLHYTFRNVVLNRKELIKKIYEI